MWRRPSARRHHAATTSALPAPIAAISVVELSLFSALGFAPAFSRASSNRRRLPSQRPAPPPSRREPCRPSPGSDSRRSPAARRRWASCCIWLPAAGGHRGCAARLHPLLVLQVDVGALRDERLHDVEARAPPAASIRPVEPCSLRALTSTLVARSLFTARIPQRPRPRRYSPVRLMLRVFLHRAAATTAQRQHATAGDRARSRARSRHASLQDSTAVCMKLATSWRCASSRSSVDSVGSATGNRLHQGNCDCDVCSSTAAASLAAPARAQTTTTARQMVGHGGS